jgi:hypothetical protein
VLIRRTGGFKPRSDDAIHRVLEEIESSSIVEACGHRGLFDEVGGYPHIGPGQDLAIELKFEEVVGSSPSRPNPTGLQIQNPGASLRSSRSDSPRCMRSSFVIDENKDSRVWVGLTAYPDGEVQPPLILPFHFLNSAWACDLVSPAYPLVPRTERRVDSRVQLSRKEGQ